MSKKQMSIIIIALVLLSAFEGLKLKAAWDNQRVLGRHLQNSEDSVMALKMALLLSVTNQTPGSGVGR